MQVKGKKLIERIVDSVKRIADRNPTANRSPLSSILSLLFAISYLLFAAFTGCATAPKVQQSINVGFDCDDTLLFSTPAFEIANKSEYSEYSDEWWAIVNKSDEGNSIVKKVTEKILNEHKQKCDEIFVITSREDFEGDILRDFLNKTFGIKKQNIYFEHKKANKIKELNISIFYGDSDSDITAAQEAGAKGIRILRSPKSSYKGKYHPGQLGEEIIPNSEE
ncbi:MAG: HAD family acid phosphatase [Elusimicrobiota bacterium]